MNPRRKKPAPLPGFDVNFPASVRYDNELTYGARLFYCEVRSFCLYTGECRATNKMLAERFGAKPDQGWRWTRELVQRGHLLIRIERSKEDGTRRFLTLPEARLPLGDRPPVDDDALPDSPRRRRLPGTRGGPPPLPPPEVFKKLIDGLLNRVDDLTTWSPRDHYYYGMASLRSFTSPEFKVSNEMWGRVREGATGLDIFLVCDFFNQRAFDRPMFWSQHFNTRTPFRRDRWADNLQLAQAWKARGYGPADTSERNSAHERKLALGR